jgi:protein SCO1/2
MGLMTHKWNLVTGDKKEIYTMYRKSHQQLKWESELYDMVHTENFVVDKRRVRGFMTVQQRRYRKLITDINFLSNE